MLIGASVTEQLEKHLLRTYMPETENAKDVSAAVKAPAAQLLKANLIALRNERIPNRDYSGRPAGVREDQNKSEKDAGDALRSKFFVPLFKKLDDAITAAADAEKTLERTLGSLECRCFLGAVSCFWERKFRHSQFSKL